jgi:hypothetical protein
MFQLVSGWWYFQPPGGVSLRLMVMVLKSDCSKAFLLQRQL